MSSFKQNGGASPKRLALLLSTKMFFYVYDLIQREDYEHKRFVGGFPRLVRRVASSVNKSRHEVDTRTDVNKSCIFGSS